MTVKSVQVTTVPFEPLGFLVQLRIARQRKLSRKEKPHSNVISNLIIFEINFLHFRFKIKLIFMSELKHPFSPPSRKKYHFQHVTLKCHSISELWQVNSFCLNLPMQSRPNPIPTVPPCTRKSPRGWEAGKTLLLRQHSGWEAGNTFLLEFQYLFIYFSFHTATQ